METQENLYIGFLNDVYGRGLLVHFSYLLSVFALLFLTTWIYFNNYVLGKQSLQKPLRNTAPISRQPLLIDNRRVT